MRVRVSLLCSGAALALAGCASLTPPDTSGPSAGVPAGSSFELAGRLSVKYEEKGFSGNLRWQHKDAADFVTIASPLGQTAAQLSSDAQGAQLITADRKVYYALSIEALVKEALGWELPITGLSYWALGHPAPGTPVNVRERDAQGRLSHFVQDSWEVSITSYAAAEGGARPARMQLNYGNNLEIRLAIDELKTN